MFELIPINARKHSRGDIIPPLRQLDESSVLKKQLSTRLDLIMQDSIEIKVFSQKIMIIHACEGCGTRVV